MHARIPLVLLVLSWALLPARARPEETGREYVFAIVPQAPPVVISARWSPIAERVAARARVRLRLELYEHIEQFQADLAKGALDLAYVNPIQVKAAEPPAEPVDRSAPRDQGGGAAVADDGVLARGLHVRPPPPP